MSIEFNEQFEKQNYAPIDSGEYEVTLARTEKKITQTGKAYLSVGYQIRSDVEQPFKGRYVFENLWIDNNPGYAKEGWYDTLKLNKIIKTQPDGPRKFEADEAIVYIKGLNMIIGIDKIFDEGTGEEKNEVRRNSYKPSAVAVTATPVTEPAATVDPEDCPF